METVLMDMEITIMEIIPMDMKIIPTIILMEIILPTVIRIMDIIINKSSDI